MVVVLRKDASGDEVGGIGFDDDFPLVVEVAEDGDRGEGRLEGAERGGAVRGPEERDVLAGEPG